MGNPLNKADLPSSNGALIVNADDWGRNRETTDRILDCVLSHSVTATSAMVYMEDSERAAELSREYSVDTGLHLNFTTPFSGQVTVRKLRDYQDKISQYLLRHRLAQVIYQPFLANSFDYIVKAQLEEYARIYGQAPKRIDGHHHMHLCANVLLGRLLPEGTIVRRSFSVCAGEKGIANRSWRRMVNLILARRHRIADFLFSLTPINPERLNTILQFASQSVVELETHPVNADEYEFLTSGGLLKWGNTVQICSFLRHFH
jgi:predicted glycoside hydrolase/deacetylase ChbG (UPF0249 family)